MNKIIDAKTKNLKHTNEEECVYGSKGIHEYVIRKVCKHCGKWQEMPIASAKKKRI